MSTLLSILRFFCEKMHFFSFFSCVYQKKAVLLQRVSVEGPYWAITICAWKWRVVLLLSTNLMYEIEHLQKQK